MKIPEKKLTVVLTILIFALLITACTAVSAGWFTKANGIGPESTGTLSSSSETESGEEVTEPVATLSQKETDSRSTKKITESTTEKTTEYSVLSSEDEDKLTGEICVENTSAVQKTKKEKTKTASYSKPQVDAEFDCFDDCCFIGNSRLLAVGNYNLAKNVYAVVGLNVETVYTKKCEGSKVPVIDELNGKDYKKVIIMFGDNECGWESLDNFGSQYKKVIASVREKLPNAEIYLVSVLPISEERSKQNQYGYNINAISNVNKIIQQVADETDCTYIDAGSSLKDSNGYLPADASTDGCHLGKDYTKIWLSVVADKVKSGNSGLGLFKNNNEEKTTFEFKGIFR